MKPVTLSPQAQTLLARMSADTAVPVEGLVNQAVFNWAKLHGYLAPGAASGKAEEPPEPETTRVPVVEPSEDWHLASGGSFAAPDPVSDMTSPSALRKQLLVLVLPDREVIVEGTRYLVGRDESCDLTINSPRISRQHAVLRPGRGIVEVEDLGSSNGTWFEGERIERRDLVHGEEVLFGDTPVRVEFRDS